MIVPSSARSNRPALWRIFGQSQASPAAVIIIKVGFEDGSEIPFSKNDHMVQSKPAERRGEDLFQAPASDSLAKLTPVDFVPIPQQVTWCRVFGKGLNHLLPYPQSCRMLRHVEVKHPSAVMRHNHQDKQDSKCDGGDGKEIDRDQFGRAVFQESLPGLGRRLATLRHQSGDRPLRNLDA